MVYGKIVYSKEMVYSRQGTRWFMARWFTARRSFTAGGQDGLWQDGLWQGGKTKSLQQRGFNGLQEGGKMVYGRIWFMAAADVLITVLNLSCHFCCCKIFFNVFSLYLSEFPKEHLFIINAAI